MDVFVICRVKSEENSKAETDVVWQSICYPLRKSGRKNLVKIVKTNPKSNR